MPDLLGLLPATVPGVIATAVLRALASPPGANKSKTVGGHSRTAAHEGGGVYLVEVADGPRRQGQILLSMSR